MSQKGEKYARRVEARVETLEERVGKVEQELARQRVEVRSMEADLAVFRAATMARELRREEGKAAQPNAAQEGRETPKEGISILETATGRAKRGACWEVRVAAATLALCAFAVSLTTYRLRNPQRVEELPTAEALSACDRYDPEQYTLEEALIAQGYYSADVPLSFEQQDYMRQFSAKYGCPYALALAVAEIESGFDVSTRGTVGEVGMMQLNPGPRGAYHAELLKATGFDPLTTEGNIANGCYLLGKYMQKYSSIERAAMAYNMGEGGARAAWARGTTSTQYSRNVAAAAERWAAVVNERA